LDRAAAIVNRDARARPDVRAFRAGSVRPHFVLCFLLRLDYSGIRGASESDASHVAFHPPKVIGREKDSMFLETGFGNKQVIAETTASILLEVQAVHFADAKPFVFTSGWASPVYIDCRKLISYPRVRRTLIDFAAVTILQEVGFETIDTIAGGETAGIPFAAWIADRLMLPMQYVRKNPKGFGRQAQIEGEVLEGQRVLLVEDLTTDGRSKINFCKALRNAGVTVDNVFVMFNYDIFPESRKILKDLDVRLHALATWRDVLAVAKKRDYFPAHVIGQVEDFLAEPAKWSAGHGGADTFPD
jgi:orotate phosphoribosyltransferase